MGQKKTGNKHALLIGCNYPGTKSELKGCRNDIRDFYGALVERLGWDFDNGDDITVMEDTNDLPWTHPTGKNIKAHLRKLVNKAEDGDVVFVHFSGHGCQIPTDDPDEEDGKDECIVPCDHNLITDDDLSEIFAPLAEKDVKLTFCADCCHSGTLLDHKEAIITGPKSGVKPTSQAHARSIDSMREALGADDEDREIKNRSLPLEELQEILSERMGLRGGDTGDVRDLLESIFGEDFGGCTKSRSFSPSMGMAPMRGVDEDVGILVSGCMDRECAADARPRNKQPPHGAFTKALTTVLRNKKEKEPISNRELVLAVRENLAMSRFRQSPCLECNAKWADAPFIVPGMTPEAELQKKAKMADSQAKPKPPAPKLAGNPTALWNACLEGQLDVAVKEIEAGVDVNMVQKDTGATFLYNSSFEGHVDLVRLLLDKGAAVNAAKKTGATPLWVASQNGHLDVVCLLLDRGATMKAKKTGATPLYIATEKGNLDMVHLLLDRGAPVDQARNDGTTPLFNAIQRENLDVVRLLLDRGAALDAASYDGLTPLLLASSKGHLPLVQLVCKQAAKVLAATKEEARKSAT